MIKALSIGQVTHDRYGGQIVPGGCAFYGAKACASLGGESRLISSVGKDFLCDHDLVNLETTLSRDGLTTVFTNIYPEGKSRVQVVESQAPRLRPQDLPADWQTSDLVFLAPVFGEFGLEEWLDLVDAPLKGCGLQGFLKQSGADLGEGRAEVVAKPFEVNPDLFAKLDAVFLSDEDIREFGTDTLLDELIECVRLVAITHGDKGCTVHFEGKTAELGIIKTDCVDPTGAGDTFAAAFLYGLASGNPIVDAAKLATAAASIVVEGRGGATLNRVSASFGRVPQALVIKDNIGKSTIK